MVDPTASFEAYVFSDVETFFYAGVFEQVSADNVAHGEAVADFLRKSNLPDEILGRIWDLTDRSLKGYLSRVEFFVAMRALAIAQRGGKVTTDSIAVLEGLAIHELPRLGPDFPLPTEDEVVSAKAKQAELFQKPLPANTINPQFKVSLQPPVKQEGSLQDHMIYAISVHCTMGLLNSTSSVVYRRYSDFEWLRFRLVEDSLGKVVPPLPEKKYFGRFESQFLEARRQGLENFINRLTADTSFMNAKPLITFLQADDESFAKAKATRPSLVEQVIHILQSSLMNLVQGGGGSGHQTLPTDARLEDFSNRLDLIKDRLKECKRLHSEMLEQSRLHTVEAGEFVMQTVPPITPLSPLEINEIKSDLLKQFDKAQAEEAKEFEGVLDNIISQVRAVQEVIKQRKAARKKFDMIQQRLDSKRHKQAAVKNDSAKQDARSDLEKDVASLGKESDAAKHRFETISQSLEKEVVDFEHLRKKETARALKSVARTQGGMARFQVNWWQNIAKRVLEGQNSDLAATVDVPLSLCRKADLVDCRPSEAKTLLDQTRNTHQFSVGQSAQQTLPLAGMDHAQSDDEWAVGEVASSLGNVDTTTHSNIMATGGGGGGGTSLPSYAQATLSDSAFKQAVQVDHDDDDDFTFTSPTSNTPSHWE